MYEAYFGFKEKPFPETPDPDFLYLSRGHREGLAFLEYHILDGKGFSVLVGEVGTGKTTLCKALKERLDPERIVLIHLCFSDLNFEEFLAEILEELGLSPLSFDKRSLLKALHSHLVEIRDQGRRVVILIDEAQHLEPAVLEKMRMLSNWESRKEKLIQLVFVGQPSLLHILDRPDLVQLKQRISGRFHLGPLTRPETHAYLDSRLHRVQGEPRVRFTSEAKDLVWRLSRGVPRLINFLCDKSLSYAFVAQNLVVDEPFVQKAQRGLQGLAGDSPFEVDMGEGLTPPSCTSFPSVAHGTQAQRAAKRTGTNPRTRLSLGWILAPAAVLVIGFVLFSLFYLPRGERPFSVSGPYRLEFALPQEKIGKKMGSGRLSEELFVEGQKPVAYLPQTMEDIPK